MDRGQMWSGVVSGEMCVKAASSFKGGRSVAQGQEEDLLCYYYTSYDTCSD